MLIDCDVHVTPETVRELADYTDSATRDLLLHSGTEGLALPDYPWYHPTGWVRKDAYDPTSADPGMHTIDLAKVQAQVLDAHDVTFGIATPDTIGGALCVMPNPVLAAKLASAHNDWLLEHYLQPEPRLRGLIAISPQNPHEAAKEIRRVGGRDEFAGIFLPGGARIPYGNPIHDPIWEAADELALPVIVHTHYEGVGIAGPVTAAGYPDFYVEYHTLCGSGMYGHFVSILCHGIFERFPNTKVMMVEGGLVPFVGLLWRLDTNWKACRSEIPWCRKPPSEYVWEHVKFSSQPLETPEDPSLLAPAIQGLRPWDTLCFASDYPHWDYDEPAQTLRTLPAEWRENVAWRNAAEFYDLPVPSAPPAPAEREIVLAGGDAEPSAAAGAHARMATLPSSLVLDDLLSRHDGDPPRAALRQAGFRSHDVDAWLERRAARSGGRPSASTLRGGPGGPA